MVVGSVLLTGCIPVTGAPAPAYTGPVRVRSTSSATDPALTATAPGGAATDQSSGPAALLGPGPGFPTPPLLETGPAAVLVRGVRPPDKTPGTATHIRCTDSSSGWQLSLWLQFTNGWVIRTPTLMYRNRPFLTTVISGDGYWYVANPQQITAACVSR
jgi:hypothetical protein